MKTKTAVLSLILLVAGFLVGAAWRHVEMAPYRTVYSIYAGLRDQFLGPITPPEERLTEKQKKAMERLRSLGYLNARNTPKNSGVTIHDESRAFQGLNLTVEGNTAEASLKNMTGETVHQWRMPFEEAFPDRSEWPPEPQTCWRRVHLLPDGSLLAIYEGHSLVKMDRDSNLLWTYTGGAHHDMDVLPDGTIYTLARTPEIFREFSGDPILHDYVAVLDPSGKEIKRVSILSALLNSPYKNFFFRADRSGDVLHTNTIEVLDGVLADSVPAFTKGRVLLSILKLSTIAVLDLESESIVWALKDFTHYQHQPTVVGGRNLLIFDNWGDHDLRSQVLEFDPATQEIHWRYDNNNGELYSKTLGSCQRLPNGNTLITESNQGRVIEVTPDHEIVWEYYSPHRKKKDNSELITQVFELIRFPPDVQAGWVQ